MHGTVAVTAVTAQHLDRVDRVEPMPPDLVAVQIDAVIDSFPIAAVKTGLLGSAEIVDLVADRVLAGSLPAPVVDPVLVDGRGNRFVGSEIERAYRERLFPAAALLTPNLGEASVLSGRAVASIDDVDEVAATLAGLGAGHVVVTGGADDHVHAVDALIDRAGAIEYLPMPRIATDHVRGSGCTLAAAATAALAHGRSVREAVTEAKRFVTAQLEATAWPDLPGGGPVAHWFGPQEA